MGENGFGNYIAKQNGSAAKVTDSDVEDSTPANNDPAKSGENHG